MKTFDNVPHNDEVENVTDFSQYPDQVVTSVSMADVLCLKP